MFKDALDQMKDDEYICKLHRQINGLKSDIEMVDQQNLSIMKTAEKHKRKAEKLERQNKRYRELLESIRYTQDVAKEIQAEKPNIKVITPDDLLQRILRKVNKELESELE